MIKIEACLDSKNVSQVTEATTAAYQGGAARIELCRAMQRHGLTPVKAHIVAARAAFQERPGLLVMIRPRGGDFVYTAPELELMRQQIRAAAEAGANGIVCGVLEPEGGLALAALKSLLALSQSLGLQVTCHRAFDATLNPLLALEQLVELGVDRILTSGIGWGQAGSALAGVDRLTEIITQARGRCEIVIGGGVNSANVQAILQQIPLEFGGVSVHAYSGVQEQGRVTVATVKALVAAANL